MSGPALEPTPKASEVDAAGASPASGSQLDVAGLFERIPQVDAVRAARPRGFRGWGVLHGLVLAVAGVVVAWWAGGFVQPLGWHVLTGVLAGLAGGLIAASYVPRRGVRTHLVACDLLPLVVVLLAPALLRDAGPVSVVLGLLVLGALAMQRLSGRGFC